MRNAHVAPSPPALWNPYDVCNPNDDSRQDCKGELLASPSLENCIIICIACMDSRAAPPPLLLRTKQCVHVAGQALRSLVPPPDVLCSAPTLP